MSHRTVERRTSLLATHGETGIYGDVIVALRTAVTLNSNFTLATFTLALVPSKPFPKGLGADIGGWGFRLKDFEHELHGSDPAYRLFVLTEDDVSATLNNSLEIAADYFTDRVLAVLGVG